MVEMECPIAPADCPDLPTVSCVIPCYENLQLFSRCLVSILTQEGVDLEVIVSDDSRTSEIANFVSTLEPHFPALRYFPGTRSGNPVENWNRGLDAARGRYCVVIHHDEFFLSSDVLAQAISSMEAEQNDVVIGRVAVLGPSRHGLVPRALLKGAPLWMMFIVSAVGPTACVIYRRSLGLRFNPKLVQLVDIEFYFRLLKAARGVCYSDVLSVGSLVHGASITARIDPHRLQVAEGLMISRDDALGLSRIDRKLLRLSLRLHGYLRGVI